MYNLQAVFFPVELFEGRTALVSCRKSDISIFFGSCFNDTPNILYLKQLRKNVFCEVLSVIYVLISLLLLHV